MYLAPSSGILIITLVKDFFLTRTHLLDAYFQWCHGADEAFNLIMGQKASEQSRNQNFATYSDEGKGRRSFF